MTLDHTQTLWVILQSKQKNLLAKISELKTFGKFKMQEFKVLYGKSTWGGWKFRTSNLQSRTFSFHDGEVALKHGDFYQPFRKMSFQTYFWIILSALLILSIVIIQPKRFLNVSAAASQAVSIGSTNTIVAKSPTKSKIPAAQPKKKQSIQKVAKPASSKITTIPKNVANPAAHQQFLAGRKNFQYGRFNDSYKLLRGALSRMTSEDQKAAKRMISDMQYAQCQQFVEQYEDRKAIIFCEKAIATSNNPEAQQFLDQQENKAKNTYLEGYTIQDVDPTQAQEKFMQVLQIARTKSTWRNKASYQIQKYKKSQKNP